MIILLVEGGLAKGEKASRMIWRRLKKPLGSIRWREILYISINKACSGEFT